MAETTPGLTPPPPASSVQAKSADDGLGKIIIMSVAGVLTATLLTIGAVGIWGPGTVDITTLTQIIFAAVAPAIAGLMGVLVVLSTRAISKVSAVEEKVDVMGANVDGKLRALYDASTALAAAQTEVAELKKAAALAIETGQAALELAKENEAARTKALEQTAIDVAAARAEIPPGGAPAPDPGSSTTKAVVKDAATGHVTTTEMEVPAIPGSTAVVTVEVTDPEVPPEGKGAK